ncbi:MAG: family 43 glycosylhydrolase [Duncaniella sp.]|nr:family 43 glycosylhydrolase [Duncaniella sp.]
MIIPGGQHGFSDYRHHEQAAGGITDFLAKALAKPRGGFRHTFDPTDPDVHDPVMARENGRYYMFTTGMGIGLMSSPDMKTWQIEKAPLDPIPAWAKGPVPTYEGHTWAPDVIKVGDRWYLYYSCSTFYKNISAIGVATNKTLDPQSPDYKWEDLGMVIQSRPGIDDWNAIDPNVIIDGKGRPWMTFGSFWDGIQLVQLKKDMKTPAGRPKTIARRRNPETVAHFQETANNNAIEAPFIVSHDGYYYLFASYDFCCRGLSSNYKTVVGRSKKIEGPYLDRNGKDMARRGGTLLAAESERYSGVGHCSVYEWDGKWYIAAHAYDKRKNGASKLFLREIKWVDGWPVIAETDNK